METIEVTKVTDERDDLGIAPKRECKLIGGKRMKKLETVILLVSVLMLSAFIVPSFAGKQGETVVKPMKGTFKGTWGATVFGVPVVPAANLGEGTFTHLGLSKYRGILTTTWNLVLGTGTVAGSLVLEAANGDTLYVDVTGTQTMDILFTFSDFTGTYVITGGTGRFEGAAGTGTISAHLTIASDYLHGDLTDGSMKGTIVLPLP